ncbi:hypothetical protein OIU78_027903 [Salix suchowensis]|nr:hypothetical protein OIU78_027903 [Salix suchowensis]
MGSCLNCRKTELPSSVAAGRKLESTKEKVDQPQNYLGGFGTSGGFVPTPNGPVFGFGPSGILLFPLGLVVSGSQVLVSLAHHHEQEA